MSDERAASGWIPGAPGGHRWDQVVLRVLRRAAMNFVDDRGTQLAASISYYALFSLFPVMLLAVAVFGVVLREEALQDRVVAGIVEQLPIEETNVSEAISAAANLGPTLTVVSLLGALWTAGALSAAVRSALNVIFEVERGRPLVRGKLVDYALLPIIGLPFLGGIVLSTAWRIVQRRASNIPIVPDDLQWFWELGAFAIALTLSFAAFLLLYWMVPNRRVVLRYTWPGALLAAVLFEALKNGFAFYVANVASYDVVYGPISGVIVLLFWVYLTSNIMLFGAEVASETPHVVYEEPRHGHHVGDEGHWRRAVWAFVRGMVLVQDESDVDGHVGEHADGRPGRRPVAVGNARRTNGDRSDG